MWPAEIRPQDRVKVRCDRSPDDRLFQVGKIYNGYWRRWVHADGTITPAKKVSALDENGENYGTYREPWFKFTIVEGPTEPPKN